MNLFVMSEPKNKNVCLLDVYLLLGLDSIRSSSAVTGRLHEGVERVGCSAAHSTTKVKWTFGNAVPIHLRYVSCVVRSFECDRATDHRKHERQKEEWNK